MFREILFWRELGRVRGWGWFLEVGRIGEEEVGGFYYWKVCIVWGFEFGWRVVGGGRVIVEG